MVEFADHHYPSALKSIDEPDLPQGTTAVESSLHELTAEVENLGLTGEL